MPWKIPAYYDLTFPRLLWFCPNLDFEHGWRHWIGFERNIRQNLEWGPINQRFWGMAFSWQRSKSCSSRMEQTNGVCIVRDANDEYGRWRLIYSSEIWRVDEQTPLQRILDDASTAVPASQQSLGWNGCHSTTKRRILNDITTWCQKLVHICMVGDYFDGIYSSQASVPTGAPSLCIKLLVFLMLSHRVVQRRGSHKLEGRAAVDFLRYFLRTHVVVRTGWVWGGLEMWLIAVNDHKSGEVGCRGAPQVHWSSQSRHLE